MCQVLGYMREEILNLAPADILDAEAREVMLDLARRIERDGRLLFETTLVRKDRQPVPVEISVHPLELPEQFLTLCVVRDITDRKRGRAVGPLEGPVRSNYGPRRNCGQGLSSADGPPDASCRALRQQALMLEAFFRDTIAPLAFLDRHFNFVRVNAAYAKAAGKDPDYFVGKNHFVLYPHEENQAIFEQTVRTQRPYHAHAKPFTYPDQPARGVTYWDWQLTPLCDEAPRCSSWC